MSSWRSYTEQERADAVGLALAVGAKQAAAKLGIPRRTISSWLQRPTPAIEAAIVASEEMVASRLWQAIEEGASAVLVGMRDPKARLSDKASALRVVVEAHALISGGPTSRTESTITTGDVLSDHERAQLADFLDGLIASGADLDAFTASLLPDGREP
ncbi:MAG TPA: helix-turn-helix domain-containing protein [Candidatus Limnocylindrales bacterium]|nr:helix-turn-helix domain-containing protein [Candidatus Limnocylindrales bacterium]